MASIFRFITIKTLPLSLVYLPPVLIIINEQPMFSRVFFFFFFLGPLTGQAASNAGWFLSLDGRLEDCKMLGYIHHTPPERRSKPRLHYWICNRVIIFSTSRPGVRLWPPGRSKTKFHINKHNDHLKFVCSIRLRFKIPRSTAKAHEEVEEQPFPIGVGDSKGDTPLFHDMVRFSNRRTCKAGKTVG